MMCFGWGAKKFMLKKVICFFGPLHVGDGPNSVRRARSSNIELSEFFALTEFWGENSVSSS